MGPAPSSMITTAPGAAATTGIGQHNTVGITPPLTTPKLVPMAGPPQQMHHMQYGIPGNTPGASTILSGVGGSSAGMPAVGLANGTVGKKRMGGGVVSLGQMGAPIGGGGGGKERKSDQGKKERRERNREHAKRSRIRKKFLLESLQQSVSLLKEENEKLRNSIRHHLGDTQADEVLKDENLADVAAAASAKNGGSNPTSNNYNDSTLIASDSNDANKVLDDPDFSFIKALQTAQQNFVVTDPSLPDNPIVYATQGFLDLTGYTLDQVLGRNCRFLQGPETDPKAVEKIRRSIEDGSDMSVCLLNYRVDGTTFWNQFFIAALRDAAGNITNYVGVQCKVSDQYAANVCKKQEEEDARAADGEGVAVTSGSGGDTVMGEECISAAAPVALSSAAPTTEFTGDTSKSTAAFSGATPTTAFPGESPTPSTIFTSVPPAAAEAAPLPTAAFTSATPEPMPIFASTTPAPTGAATTSSAMFASAVSTPTETPTPMTTFGGVVPTPTPTFASDGATTGNDGTAMTIITDILTPGEGESS